MAHTHDYWWGGTSLGTIINQTLFKVHESSSGQHHTAIRLTVFLAFRK